MTESLKKLLEIRDQREKLPFENLIYTINEYASELESSLILVDSLKASLKRARSIHREEVPGGSSSSSSLELEIKLKELKEERAELYRQQGIQATHLLSLNDQLRQKDTLITQHATEICSLKVLQEKRDEEVKILRERMREKEEGAKIIGDELVALQLELLRLDQWQQAKGSNDSTVQDIGNSDNTMTSTSLIKNDSNVSLFNRKICNLKMIKEKEIIAPHQYPISTYASKASTRQLLTGSEDQKIILYDLTRISTKLVLKWSKMNGPIVSLAVDEEGKLAASCSAYDKEITIWGLGNGKIQGTLSFTDDSSDIPFLHFGSQSRLWMSLGRTVRLWDVQRGLLLRSWNREIICNPIQKIISDSKRPDRLWCFDEKGSFAVLNAVTGKLEINWKSLVEGDDIIYDCTRERIVLARRSVSGGGSEDDWIITGYNKNSHGTGLEGVYEFSLRFDLLGEVKGEATHSSDNEENKKSSLLIKSISIHPDRPDLLSLILSTNKILFIKVSQDNWNPDIMVLSDRLGDTILWGPEEADPISGEKGCKVVVIEKETKKIELYTISRI